MVRFWDKFKIQKLSQLTQLTKMTQLTVGGQSYILGQGSLSDDYILGQVENCKIYTIDKSGEGYFLGYRLKI